VSAIKINVWLIYVLAERHFPGDDESVEADGALRATGVDFVHQFL
jgi:hypothetical protein